MKKLLIIIGMVLLCQGCVILAEFTDGPQADYMNPCTDMEYNPYQDCDECMRWKENHSKEYSRYADRMWSRKIKFCR